jgi:hypothetical protein
MRFLDGWIGDVVQRHEMEEMRWHEMEEMRQRRLFFLELLEIGRLISN